MVRVLKGTRQNNSESTYLFDIFEGVNFGRKTAVNA